MKLTKREKEIVLALRDGARLHPPGFMGRQWQIQRLPVTSTIGEWVYNDTIQRFKQKGILERKSLPGEMYSQLVPTKEALEVAV